MSLFSGMRLTSGKKQTQSISAKVQDEDEKMGNKGGSTKQAGGQSVALKQSCSPSSEMTQDTGATMGATNPAKARSAKVGTTNLKAAKGSGASDGTTSGTSLKEGGGGSMFSFIVETTSELDSHSHQEKCVDGSPVENVDISRTTLGKTGEGSSAKDMDIIMRTSTESGHKVTHSPSLDLELDPFSVDKPAGRTKTQPSKLSFDLEGLDLTSVAQSTVQDKEVLSDESLEENDRKTSSIPEHKETRLKIGADDASNLTNVLSGHSDNVSNQVDNGDATGRLEDKRVTDYVPVSFEEDTKTAKESAVAAVEGEDLSRDLEDEGELCGQEDGDGTAASGQPQYDVELSFKDKLVVMQQMHTAKLKHFSEALSELMSQISVATSDCIQCSTKLLHKQQTLRRTQCQQSEAVVQEDYEHAESLNEQCEILEAELQKIPSHAIPSNHPVILDLVDTITKLHLEERACRDGQLRDLDEMRKKQEVIVEEVKGQCAKTETTELCELEEEKSALQRDVGHLNLDKEHLDRKEKQLEKRIDEKTIDFKQGRDELVERRTALQDQIKELEKKLTSLKDQEQELSKEILHQEELIAKTREEFDDEIDALEKERSKVNRKEEEVQIREDRVNRMEKTIDSRLEMGKAEVIREEALLDTVTLEMQKLEQEMSELDDAVTSESIPTVLMCTEEHQKLYSLQEKLKTNSATVQSLTAEVLQAQTKIVSLRQKVSDTEGHIAALTEAKQLAVSGRNFAEAKRLANEIKELTCEGQKSQSELEKTIATRDKSNRDLETLKEAIVQMKTELAEEELQYDSDIKNQLLQHVQTLQQITSTDKINSLSRTISEADIKSCSVLIQYLCIKHGDPLPDCLQEYVTEVELTKDTGKNVQMDSPRVTTETSSSVVTSEVSELHSKIAALESQLQAAVDQEDYDTAHILCYEVKQNGWYSQRESNFRPGFKPGSSSELVGKGRQEFAFTTLKGKLANSPILHLPDLNQQFILRTDASNTGVGAVLLQEFGGEKFPVAFASKKFTKCQRAYSVIERECLAVISAVQKFEPYLYGREFILETDHQPLRYIQRSKVANGRIMRWALALQPYRFRIMSIKGKENVGADYMSRSIAELD